MEVIRSEADMGGLRRRAVGRVGLVATMGAFHPGHVSIMARARADTDVVVVSIFVNPLQFGPEEDYAAYPRDEARDLAVAVDAGVDVVFAPVEAAMFPPRRTTTVSVGRLGAVLEGRARPGHFDGVCTVVAKLFNIVRPDVAFFGQKDAQQIAVIRRMVADLSFDIEIVACPTVRAGDGLALSSRNLYLNASQRAAAGALHRALKRGAAALSGSGRTETAEAAMVAALRSGDGVEADYARAVDPETFEPASPGRPVLLVVAARIGRARLIDNLLVGAEH